MTLASSALISGPHHCVGSARTIIDLIFDRLTKKRELLSRDLNKDDLLSMKAELVETVLSASPAFEHTYRACKSAKPPYDETAIWETDRFSAILSLYTRRAAERSFLRQTSLFANEWLASFYSALAYYLGTEAFPQADILLATVYARLGYECGQELRVMDLTSNKEIHKIVVACIDHLAFVSPRTDALLMLVSGMNQRITASEIVSLRRIPYIDATEMRKFILNCTKLELITSL